MKCPNCGYQWERLSDNWILVEDRLPEKHGEYIVAYGYGCTGTSYFYTNSMMF